MSQSGQRLTCNLTGTVKACHSDNLHTQWRRVAAEKSVRLRRAYHRARTLPCKTFRISASDDIEPNLSFVERDAGTFTFHFRVAVLHVRQEQKCLGPSCQHPGRFQDIDFREDDFSVLSFIVSMQR